jgi:uncharacterized protein
LPQRVRRSVWLYTETMSKIWLVGAMCLCLAWSAVETSYAISPEGAGYAAELQAKREARDKRFRDPASSPLAVEAIARLDRARTTIGSSPDADLRIASPTVEAVHAEILREEEAGASRWTLRQVSGEVVEERSGRKVTSDVMGKRNRFRIGSHAIYFDELGTFGAVVRAVDPSSSAIQGFNGLKYFVPDPQYLVEAELVPNPEMEPIMVADTNGWNRPGWRFGEAHFELQGRQVSLVLLLFTPDPGPGDSFFVAFRDATTGDETYGAGRYLDVPFAPSGRIIIDFNEAYNPSCAYNNGFACPLPPRENRLPVAIRAGEKKYD